LNQLAHHTSALRGREKKTGKKKARCLALGIRSFTPRTSRFPSRVAIGKKRKKVAVSASRHKRKNSTKKKKKKKEKRGATLGSAYIYQQEPSLIPAPIREGGGETEKREPADLLFISLALSRKEKRERNDQKRRSCASEKS